MTIIDYDNQAYTTQALANFQSENEPEFKRAYNDIVAKILSLYQRYGITKDDDNFSRASYTLMSATDSKAMNDELYRLYKLIDDSDFQRELYPKKLNLTVYDYSAAEITLGLATLFLVMTGRITKQSNEVAHNESVELSKQYGFNGYKQKPTALDKKDPYLMNHYLQEIYRFRFKFRSDTLANRSIEKSVDELQKRAKILSNYTRASLIDRMTSKQLDVQAYYISKSTFEYYQVMTENNACPICLPLNAKKFPIKDIEPSVNAPKFHPNCRCRIAGVSSPARQ